MSVPREILKRLPKVELHCHLDGSVRYQTAYELAVEQGLRLPADSPETFRPYVQVAPSCKSLTEFLKTFGVLLPLLQKPDALERITYELLEDSAKENIRFVEIRFAPLLHTEDNLKMPEIIDAVQRGIDRGKKDFDVDASIILCLFRSHGPDLNGKAFEAVKDFYGKGVVGLDVAGDESKYPTRLYADFFKEARKLGIWATVHAGETSGTENLKAALDLKVDRIGHGIHLGEDKDLQQEVVKRGIPLEMSLLSNIRTSAVPSAEAHPLPKFYRDGVGVTLNTDDRGILGSSLTEEYETANSLGLSFDDLARIALRGVDALFQPEKRKSALRYHFEREIEGLRAKVEDPAG